MCHWLLVVCFGGLLWGVSLMVFGGSVVCYVILCIYLAVSVVFFWGRFGLGVLGLILVCLAYFIFVFGLL